MPVMRSVNVDPRIIAATQRERNFACLSGKTACAVEPYMDRDLHLLRCRDTRPCAFRRQCLGQNICSCPVNRASFGF